MKKHWDTHELHNQHPAEILFPDSVSEGFLLFTSSVVAELLFPGRCRRGCGCDTGAVRLHRKPTPQQVFYSKIEVWGHGLAAAWAGPGPDPSPWLTGLRLAFGVKNGMVLLQKAWLCIETC